MHRSTLDKLISSFGLLVALILIATSIALWATHSFINGQIYEQLSSQKIMFPEAGSKAISSLPPEDQIAISQYAGQQLTTGAQARVFADNYIAVHLQQIGEGKTYSELSAQAMANPDDKKLAGKVDTVFRGETLRGMLLNAYAFGTMATIASFAALGAAIAAVIMLILVLLGFRHAKTASKSPKKRK